MKLPPREVPAYFERPDPARPAVLIYGGDGMRVALRRQQLIAALTGPDGDAEMRIERIAAADLRQDGARLVDALKATGFFAGQRVVFVDGAGDGLTDRLEAALAEWAEGDAQIVVTAGQLAARSRLRKLFESHDRALAVAIYDDPPGRAEIERALAAAGLRDTPAPAMGAITALSRDLDPGDFRQFLEKLSLYKLGDTAPLSVDDVEAVAPLSTEAGQDDLIHRVAEADDAAVGPLLRRLEAQGVQPVGLCIGALRHFRALHGASADPKGAAAGIARARVPWKSRDRMQRQAERWGTRRLETAIAMLVDTDLALRSASPAPAMPVMERTLVRLARLTQQ